MVDRELIQRRLERLDEYLKILRRAVGYEYGEFAADPERYGSVERFLQLAIELVTDIGNHIVSDESLGSVASASDVPRLLAEAGLVESGLAEQWGAARGLREALSQAKPIAQLPATSSRGSAMAARRRSCNARW